MKEAVVKLEEETAYGNFWLVQGLTTQWSREGIAALPGKTMNHGRDNCLQRPEEKIVSVESEEGAVGKFLLISLEKGRQSPFLNE